MIIINIIIIKMIMIMIIIIIIQLEWMHVIWMMYVNLSRHACLLENLPPVAFSRDITANVASTIVAVTALLRR